MFAPKLLIVKRLQICWKERATETLWLKQFDHVVQAEVHCAVAFAFPSVWPVKKLRSPKGYEIYPVGRLRMARCAKALIFVAACAIHLVLHHNSPCGSFRV